jgi:hypothetical protein
VHIGRKKEDQFRMNRRDENGKSPYHNAEHSPFGKDPHHISEITLAS